MFRVDRFSKLLNVFKLSWPSGRSSSLMKKITLEITTAYQTQTLSLEDEISIGRTELADLVLDDPALSKVNTTIFRDEGDVLVVDEGSSNGTFLNGVRLGREPKLLFDGDEIRLGSVTRIGVSIGEKTPEASAAGAEPSDRKQNEPRRPVVKPDVKLPSGPGATALPPSKETPVVLIVAALSTFLIILLAMIGLLIASYYDSGDRTRGTRKTPRSNQNAVIPIRVIDPLGGQKQEDLDELVQYWEVQEKEVQAEDLADISGTDTGAGEEENYNVSVEYWKKQRAAALAARNAPTGNDPPGTKVPRELFGDGVVKQKAKIREMQREGYVLPMDFADLALKRKAGELVELKMATDYWVLEVGGSSNTEPFTSFNFDDQIKSPAAAVGSNDFNALLQLASNFSGVKYDLMNPDHRRQMKIRLLRMFHPRAKPILMRLAQAYNSKFRRPLRVTSLSRSMEYQISLNKNNPNSFKVRGAGSLPPHTSGCAFDLARKHMTAEEQNFMMEELAKMEQEGILDALREGNLNACFHVFIYDDGVPPRM